MHWRIFQEETNSGAFNMAADEYLLLYSKQPCIRFYKWQPACISLGYNQLISDVDVGLSQKEGVDIVRRPTGGRAVFHDVKDHTYSVIAPLPLFGDVQKAYHEICSWLLDALADVGVKASLNGTNDVVVGKKKISGNAMVVKNNKLLQHGTIVADARLSLMSKLLHFQGGEELIASLSSYTKEDFSSLLWEHFTRSKDFQLSTFTALEREAIMQLSLQKYASMAWTKGTLQEKQKGACHIILG